MSQQWPPAMPLLAALIAQPSALQLSRAREIEWNMGTVRILNSVLRRFGLTIISIADEQLFRAQNEKLDNLHRGLSDKIDILSRSMTTIAAKHVSDVAEVQKAYTDACFNDLQKTMRNIEMAVWLNGLVLSPDLYIAHKRIIEIAALLSPRRACDFNKIRIGSKNDGGYIMLDDFQGLKEVFSFGIGNDVEWDRYFADKGIVVHQFDHTIEGPPVVHPNFRFNKTELSKSVSERSTTLAHELQTMIEPTVLKIDIEGSEWQVFNAVPKTSIENIKQIVCEFHSFGAIGADAQFETMRGALTTLAACFDVIHVHANNYGPWLQIGGVSFPSVLEVTFVNRKFYKTIESDEFFPGELDAPNDPTKPDLILGNFKLDSAGITTEHIANSED